MDKYNTLLFRAYEKVIGCLGGINWERAKTMITGKRYFNLRDSDHDFLRSTLAKGYYIILTRRNTHLSTYLISLASLVNSGKLSHWSHALVNLEGDDPVLDTDFRLIEATGTGVHYSDFMKVFDCDSVVLLRPRNVSETEFNFLMEEVLEGNLQDQIGKKYDNLFDLMDNSRISCVELVRTALKIIPGYESKFSDFESKIQRYGNLTPGMFYDCADFEVIWENRR